MSDSTNKFSLSRKVLVVSTWAPPMVGGPQNLYNLFSHFTARSYCVLTSYEAIQRGKTAGAWLTGEYFFYDKSAPVGKSILPSSSSSVEKPIPSSRSRPTLFGRAYESLLLLSRRLPKPAVRLLEIMIHTTYLLTGIFMMVRMGTRVVRQRKIECLMGISDIGPALISTYLISRLTGVPYVLYLFDIYLGNNLQPVNRLFAKTFEPRVFKTASSVIVTNEATSALYRKRYGNALKCVVVHNSTFPEEYEARRTPYEPQEPYTILFTGHVYWAQERSLMNLIRAIEGLKDLRIRLDLYVPNLSTTPETLKRLADTDTNMRLSSAAQSQMPTIQSSATILFLPLSWHTQSPEIIATATPGKLVDYLAAGRPILIHAPPYSYVAQYAKENQFALVVDEEDTARLQEAIRKLVFDVRYSRQLIGSALQVFHKNHDAHANARELTEILESL